MGSTAPLSFCVFVCGHSAIQACLKIPIDSHGNRACNQHQAQSNNKVCPTQGQPHEIGIPNDIFPEYRFTRAPEFHRRVQGEDDATEINKRRKRVQPPQKNGAKPSDVRRSVELGLKTLKTEAGFATHDRFASALGAAAVEPAQVIPALPATAAAKPRLTDSQLANPHRRREREQENDQPPRDRVGRGRGDRQTTSRDGNE
jgi:hypothetical protein